MKHGLFFKNFLVTACMFAVCFVVFGVTMLTMGRAFLVREQQTRLYASAEGELRLSGYPGREETIRLQSSWLNVDGCLSFLRAYGGEGMVIYRPAEQQIRVLDYPHTSLYADELCTQFEDLNAFFPCGSVVLDTGFAVTVGLSAEQTAQAAANIQPLALGEQLRGVALRGVDGVP